MICIKVLYPTFKKYIFKTFYIICSVILGLFNLIFIILFYFNNKSVLKFLNIEKEFKDKKNNFNIIIEDLFLIDNWYIFLCTISFMVICKII